MFAYKTKPEVANIKDVYVLNHTIGKVLRQHLSHDLRNIATFLAMLISLIASQSVHLSAWIQGMPGNTKAKSRIRRLTRWLSNSSIDPHVRP